MSSFPMMSTVHHCRNHRHSVEKVDDTVVEMKTPPRLIMPEMTAMTVQSLSSPHSAPVTPPVSTPLTSPVSNIAVVTLKPICRPIIGIFRKESFMSNVPFIFPNQN
ncbi:Ovule protein [Caenorhabditis elegans]|uniref:Ovule protein n=1 Tax=Caenorhabditis elegans TaxID=6239 RepID=D5MCV4_CAEEL|nr:Ovule protein [Caenorhabditis elegans]CBL43448.1 Ovule protein [Caenorhabditis elegans]|eukprot:NP_001257252.1 Uncharacterized protein CELE_H40L08.2 [Caenorhabditis elegans]